jgi:hypothetical protein
MANGSSEPLMMRKGVVGIMDALGFKGIWKRLGVPATLSMLRHVKDAGAAQTQFTNELSRMLWQRIAADAREPSFALRVVSDTIIVAAQGWDDALPNPRSHAEYFLAQVVGICRECLSVAAKEPEPVSFRGCIAVGDVCIQDDFVLGDAVDEAAQWHEQAEAALVWLAPSALRMSTAENPFNLLGWQLLRWNVPLKGGCSYETFAVNPHPLDQDVEQRLLQSFGDRVEVNAKKQHTRRFLEAARAQFSESRNEHSDEETNAND